MKNLKIFGSAIHDTAIVFIVSASLTSVGFSFFGEIGRFEANVSILVAAITSATYYFKEYSK